MTNEERCLKLMKLKRYESDLKIEEQNVSLRTMTLTFLVLSSAILLTTGSHTHNNQIIQSFSTVSGIIGAGLTPLSIKNLIESVCKKSGLKSKIDDINLDLEFENMSPGGKKL